VDSILARYTVISRLGNLSNTKFGELYLIAYPNEVDKAVLKILKKRKINPQLAERLKKEASFSFQIQGLPNIREFHESEEYIYLVRNYVEGVTLLEFWEKLRRKERIPFLISLLEKLAPLFEHLTENQIVHADIKPSNILISGNKTDFQVHLIDFGLAIRTNEVNDRPILFSLGYAAPELILNRLDCVDQTTDIYSLGHVIWRLFAGKLPLINSNPSIMTNLHITYRLPDHSRLPKRLYPILHKMCFKFVFRMPPNKLAKKEIVASLRQANTLRFQNMKEVIHLLKSRQKRSWKRVLFNKNRV
jgi:serine/threonine protein kinase